MEKIPQEYLISTYASAISSWQGKHFLEGDMLERMTIEKNGELSVV